MRAAPIGVYFADNPDAVVLHARASAEVTHAHPEGQAGAIAVAVGAAWAAGVGDARAPSAGRALLSHVARHTPDGETRAGLERAAALPLSSHVRTAVARLGNGSHATSADTVPFALWCAARHLGDFAEAMWTTVSGLGDRDTTCAIAGGVVALSAGGVPEAWHASREPLSGP